MDYKHSEDLCYDENNMYLDIFKHSEYADDEGTIVGEYSKGKQFKDSVIPSMDKGDIQDRLDAEKEYQRKIKSIEIQKQDPKKEMIRVPKEYVSLFPKEGELYVDAVKFLQQANANAFEEENLFNTRH